VNPRSVTDFSAAYLRLGRRQCTSGTCTFGCRSGPQTPFAQWYCAQWLNFECDLNSSLSMPEFTPAASDDTKTPKSPTGSNDDPTSPRGQSRTGSTMQLNPRSCVTCRRRKVRCDKKNPCSNCTKQGIECIFPGPGRAPRKARKPPDSELLSRLRRLEGVVKSLGAQVDEDGGITQAPRAMSGVFGQTNGPSGRSSPEGMENSHRYSIDKHLGRLVINEGRSRYVSNVFWASMGDEVCLGFDPDVRLLNPS